MRFLDITYLNYPICAITGCALVLGIVESIVYKKKTDSAIKAKLIPERALKRKRGVSCECKMLKQKAFKAVKNVEQDVRELLGVSQVSLVVIAGPWTTVLRFDAVA